MKILTLTQPWATLVALGEKKIETRSWGTDYRGPLGIHAAKGFPKWAKDACTEEAFFSVLRPKKFVGEGAGNKWIGDFPLGFIVAICELVDVSKIYDSELSPYQSGWLIKNKFWEASPQEKAFGFYSYGRYMWFLDNVKTLPEPIPARGYQRLWNYDLGVTA